MLSRSSASAGMTICRMPASRHLLPARDKGRRGRHGEGAVSQNIVRDLQQKGRVHAAGKGDREAAQFQKPAAESIIFGMQRIHSRPSFISGG